MAGGGDGNRDDRNDEYSSSYAGPPRSTIPPARESQDHLLPPDMTPAPGAAAEDDDEVLSVRSQDLVSAHPSASDPPEDVDDHEDDDEEDNEDDGELASADGSAPLELTKRRKHIPRARQRAPIKAKSRPNRHDSGSNIPKVADLKRRTLESIPPVPGALEAALREDALFTSNYEDPFASLRPDAMDTPRDDSDSIEPPPDSDALAVLAAARAANAQRAKDAPVLPSSRRKSKRDKAGNKRGNKRGNMGRSDAPPAPREAAARAPGNNAKSDNGRVVYASVLAFVLGVATTLAVERIFERRDEPAPVSENIPITAAPPPPAAVPVSTAETQRDDTTTTAPEAATSADPTDVDDWASGTPSATPTTSVAPWPSDLSAAGPSPSDPQPATTTTTSSAATPEPTASAKPVGEPGPFDKGAAQAAVASAAAAAAGCADGVSKGRAPMSITFAPSGRATVAIISGYSPLAGTTVGSCVARTMQTARVPPFSGAAVTVRKTVTVH